MRLLRLRLLRLRRGLGKRNGSYSLRWLLHRFESILLVVDRFVGGVTERRRHLHRLGGGRCYFGLGGRIAGKPSVLRRWWGCLGVVGVFDSRFYDLRLFGCRFLCRLVGCRLSRLVLFWHTLEVRGGVIVRK